MQQSGPSLRAGKREERKGGGAEAEATASGANRTGTAGCSEGRAGAPRPRYCLAPSSLFTIQRDVEASPTGGTRNKSLYSRSIGECEQTCAQRPTCNVFTYAKSIGAGACYLYTRAELKPNAGFDSGIRNSVNQTASAEFFRTAYWPIDHHGTEQPVHDPKGYGSFTDRRYPNKSLHSRSIGECALTCAQRPTCNVFTYAKSIGAGACYLYTRAELKSHAGFDYWHKKMICRFLAR